MQLIGDDHLQVKGWLQVSKGCLQVAPGEGQEEEEEEGGCRCAVMPVQVQESGRRDWNSQGRYELSLGARVDSQRRAVFGRESSSVGGFARIASRLLPFVFVFVFVFVCLYLYLYLK